MRKLLLFSVSMLLSICAFAQWEKPTCPAGAELQYSTIGTEFTGDTIQYYLYNEEADAFYSQGNAWGTQASWTRHPGSALKTFFVKFLGTEETEWDGSSMNIFDYPPQKNAWMNLFVDTEDAMFVDHGNQKKTMIFGAEKNNDAYRFYANGRAALDTDEKGCFERASYPTCYLGINISMGDTIVYPLLDLSEESVEGVYLVDWKLIPVDDPFIVKYTAYYASGILYDAIQNAKSSDYADILTDEIASAQAVYDNHNSTSDDLYKAVVNLNRAVNYASVMGATNDNPKDATPFIKNNDFSSGNIDGWTCTFAGSKNATNVGYQNATYTNGNVTINQFIEAWANTAFNSNYTFRALGDAKLSQLMPDLPAGKYKFTCDAIACNQDGNADQATGVKGVELFALGGSLEAKQSIHTGNSLPEHFEVMFINPGGDVELGLRTQNTDANWIAADNFTLTYYGEVTEDPEKIFLDEVIEKCEKAIPNAEEAYANAEVKAAYLKALEDAKNATENYTTYQAALEEAFAPFQTSVNSYNTYIQRVKEIQEDIAENEYTAPEIDLLSDYVAEEYETEPDEDFPNGSYLYIITNGKLNDEQIVAEIAWLNNLFQTVVANSMSEGYDCTKMIVNPNFADVNGKGWTKNPDISGMNIAWTGGLIPNFPCAESYHTYFDIYQDVVAPDGIYALSLNGFCRLDDGVDTQVPAEIYMNNGSTRLMNILEDKLPKGEEVDGYNCYLSNGLTGAWTENPVFEGATISAPADNIDSQDDEGYWPNGMTGASVAFSADRYKATVYGIINGGKMRIGVRNTKSTHVWALWGNFKLTYMGKNAEALEVLITDYIAQIDEVLEQKFNGELRTELTALRKAADSALESKDVDAMYDTLLNLLDVLKASQESVESYKSFGASVDELASALEEFGGTAKQEEFDKASTLFETVSEAYEGETADDEQIAAYKEQITEAVSKLKIPAVDPTDDNPADFTSLIVNPTFESNATPWILKSKYGQNIQWQSASYTGDVTIAGFAETWRPAGSGIGKSFVRQSINYLPAGTYMIEASAIACDQPNAASSPAHDVYLFAYEGSEDIDSLADESFVDVAPISTLNESPSRFELIFKKASDESLLTIGVMATDNTNINWLAVDDFAMTYYGKNSQLVPTSILAIDEFKPVVVKGIFNLAGQRLTAPQQGINIIDGKKVLVK